MKTAVDVIARTERAVIRMEGTRVCFSPQLCFTYDDSPEEVALLRRLAEHLQSYRQVAVFGNGPLLAYFLKHNPEAAGIFAAVICEPGEDPAAALAELPHFAAENLPAAFDAAFLCETLTVPRHTVNQRLPKSAAAVHPTILADLAPEEIPPRGWVPIERNIYPVRLPELRIRKGLDLLLADCPARNLALMPNGLAYVHNALKKTSIDFQTFDLDIVAYHRYHLQRIFDQGGRITLGDGSEMPLDPWKAEHYDIWREEPVLDHFKPLIVEFAQAIIAARPKAVGFSLQQCNESFTRRVINYVKAACPEIIILAGGFSCYMADIGRRGFPECDYMCIGEADLSVGRLVESLARGERPANLPGVISRYDDPALPFIPAPMPHDLDAIEFPKYEWSDLDLYQGYDGYQLVPVIASRGCRWARCTFCAERFYWRIRSAENFVDELEWLVAQGCRLFMFNESDLNGMPERLLDICDEIIRRGLRVKLTGQLRIHKRSDRAYFDKLKQAGFVALRFGVDAFSENTLRLQRKGYTKAMVSQNLKDCWEAGIYTEVNWVIGVPGETDADVDEGIEFILENQRYIGRLANINPLILVNGGVYWLEPEAHNIHFRAPKEEIFARYVRALPSHLWYSTEPYIDANVRKQRFEHTARRLHERGFPIGDWAARIINDVETGHDKNRSTDQAQQAQEIRLERPKSEYLETRLGYDIYRIGAAVIAVPAELKDFAFDRPESWPAAVLKEENLGALVNVIEETSDWANSRGQYDSGRREKGRTLFRAGSSLATEAEAMRQRLEGPHVIVRRDRDFAAIPAAAWARVCAAAEHGLGPQAKPDDLIVDGIFSSEPLVDLYETVGDTNIVEFDGLFFGIPEQLGRVLPHRLHEAEQLGIVIGKTFRAVRAQVCALQGRQADWHSTLPEADDAAQVMPQPQPSWPIKNTVRSAPEAGSRERPYFLGELSGYRIVTYEGWVYGLPKALGDLDLTSVDVLDLPEVIRDLSQDVVENEIAERAPQAAGAA